MISISPTGFECQHLYKAYQTRNGVIPALEDVNFSAGEQEFVCIVGPSGCGKTTLLKLLAGLLEPTSGRIVFAAEPPVGRPRSALVFQEHGLFPWMTVLNNVAFGLEMQGVRRLERRRRARAFIEQVGLASFADSYPHELSVGMSQRVGIARAFVADAPILLMDEPFGSLDAQTKLVLREELLRLWKDDQKLVVYVTHDIEEAVLLGDRVLVMTGRPGSIREEIPIPLPRPRDLSASEQPEVKEIKWHIWKMLEEEVRKSLWIRN
ncbi:MAG: ABC transporter ATP-binding protein [Chloroflexi bacterium]|nr:ABC transporter ATP-binding protein [Chloroflexota bacterium]